VAHTPVLLPAVPQEEAPAEEEKTVVRKFFVRVTKSRRFRRLRRWGGCGSGPGFNITEYESFDSLEGVMYDSMTLLASIAGSVRVIGISIAIFFGTEIKFDMDLSGVVVTS